MPFKFERLLVWQKAIDLSLEIDRISKKFPKEELYILNSQIKRATDSIALNIAEGSTSQSNPEFNRFLNYALRSDIEVVSCLFLAQKRNIISNEDFKQIYHKCEEILIMINALKRTITKNKLSNTR
ncbi:four helix bundle protein [Flavobacterium silvaticum]|uniref:Four helix bundle protein n=1 Tax=Flavobacterium silvaticum TaxID=1852020 RepID=A0A972FV23_9FLAO|nr:four helix bundle protein [Flavobacterium silvaticum]NMH29063.1 four helix bundle protein [Flavobacterium silvaticum]